MLAHENEFNLGFFGRLGVFVSGFNLDFLLGHIEVVEPAVVFGEADWVIIVDIRDDFADVIAIKVLNKNFVRFLVPEDIIVEPGGFNGGAGAGIEVVLSLEVEGGAVGAVAKDSHALLGVAGDVGWSVS